MILIKRALPLSPALVFCWTGILFANYTIVLKNGRRFTVKSHREVGEMIKVRGTGGKFGIAKDQIEAIIDPGADEEKGMVVHGSNRIQPTVTRREASENTPPKGSNEVSEGGVPEKRAAVPSRVRTPLTPYSPKEKKLSQLRGQILALENKRDRLIQEMRRKNFNTASPFLE